MCSTKEALHPEGINEETRDFFMYVVLFGSKLSLFSAIAIAKYALSDSFFLFVLRRAFLSQLAKEDGGRGKIQIGRQLKINASYYIFPVRIANFVQNVLRKYNNYTTL